jgi:hypothetical protein
MSLLTGFNISLDEVGLLGQASQAAFVGGNIPAGWTVVTPAQLGLGSQYRDGIYFTDPTSGASAIVLKQEQGSSYIVAFRGTDGQNDILLHYPELLTGTYIHHYDPLLNPLSAIALSGVDFAFTGASLGGGATNLIADIAGSAFGGALQRRRSSRLPRLISARLREFQTSGSRTIQSTRPSTATQTSRRAWTTLCSRQASTWRGITTGDIHLTTTHTRALSMSSGG